MKARLLPMGTEELKARIFFLESLRICAHDHILSRWILERVSNASGPMFASVSESLDLTLLTTYGHYYVVPDDAGPYETGHYPQDLLVAFVKEFLQATPGGIVVSENWAARRSEVASWPWPPPKVLCYGDHEVYHIVTPDITDPDQIEAAVVAAHHWQTNVCSSVSHVPDGDTCDEHFLREVVDNMRHLFIPAFDGSRYLIWSLERVQNPGLRQSSDHEVNHLTMR